MLYRKLGNTGYLVSSIGFGTWQIGGGRWQIESEAKVVDLLQEANDLGVNIFDAAVVYGQYTDENEYLQSRSQELLGRAFATRREQVIYCIKLGQFDEFSHRHDYSPNRIIKQFKQSLRRLKTDYIDICLIHAPSVEAVKNQRAITVLQTLQALGLVKSIGYSFESEPEHVAEAIKQPIDVIMLQYNLIDTDCQAAIEQARIHGVGILVGGPYKRGYLTGKYRHIQDLPNDDDYWNLNLNLNKTRVEELLEEVNGLLAEYHTPENLRREALNFILKQPGAASCVVGHRHISEVIENIRLIERPNSNPNNLVSPDFVTKISKIK